VIVHFVDIGGIDDHQCLKVILALSVPDEGYSSFKRT
jgi:hypothetical protein